MKTILVTSDNKIYRAISNGKSSSGKTIGQAVDALTAQFENPDDETLYIVQRWQPDDFFTAEQQKRLSELMKKLRDAQNFNQEFTLEDREELEKLIKAELEGSGKRAEKIANELGR